MLGDIGDVAVGTLKTRDLKNMDRVTKHKCSNNVKRRRKSTGISKKTPYLMSRQFRVAGSWLSHLPHRYSDNPVFVL